LDEDWLQYVPLGVLLLAAKFVTMSFVGWKSGWKEDKGTIICYSISLLIFGSLAGLMFFTVLIFSVQFQTNFDAVCASHLD
jgi:hypothetical protein